MFRAQVSKWLRHADSADDDTAAAPADSRTARELGCLELIAEDFATHCRDPFQPGFWAICVHRLGSRISDARAPAVRRVGDGAYAALSTLVDWAWGIHIPRTVELGRRVRLWHNGCMVLRARSIGNDVHIRHVTTLGPARDDTSSSSLPVIEDRADIGAGACVLGGVTVGHDSVVGANSVVVQDVPPRMVVLGAPARAIPSWSVSAKSVPDRKPCDHTGLPPGDRDENPAGIRLRALLREDLQTHGGSLASPGFWALAVHRIGNWRMGVRSRVARAPLTLLYRVAHQAVVAMWGIDLPYNARVGRRLRIEHHGALFIGASQIGDDVHIRGPVTVGLRRREVLAAPTIGDRVELQPNACVVGSLHLGDDSLIGAHAVVARDVRPGSTVFGIPGQCVDPAQCFEPAGGGAGAPVRAADAPPPPSAELAIIILNYRTPALAIQCLESLRGEVRPGIKVVIVDNASGDGSADRIASHVRGAGCSAWAEVVRSPTNGGFAAGNNLGVRAVHARAYVLLNSDTVVRPGAIAELLRALAAHPRAGLVGPSFENGQGAIRREVIEQVGLLDEEYFMYFEDVDYCRKVRQAGWTILYWPRARVVHFVGGSSQISSAPARRRDRPPAPRAAASGSRLPRDVIGLGGLVELLREDFATNGRSLASPGFWAVAAHRFGAWVDGVRPGPARAGLGVAHRTMATSIDWLWGIRIGRDTRLGRRVRVWHHGATVLDAVAIGDDVQIRHNTTLGVARGRDVDGRPVIEDRVDLGVGACVLGAVTVGHDAVVDANAVVLKSCPPGARMTGVPARAAEPRRAGAVNVARVDVPRVDVPRVDVSRVDVSRVDVSRVDVSRVDVSRLAGYPVKPPSMTSV